MKIQLLKIFLIILVFSACQEEEQLQIVTAKGKKMSVEEVDLFFSNLMDSLKMPGLSLAIINDAQIVYHNTFGVKEQGTEEKVDKATYFEAASLSKPIFAFFVMKQVEKGLIDLDRPLFEYLPYPDIEYDERYKMITARMILSHSSGFPNWRGDSLEIQFTPGTKYQYSGEGYRYLADVIAAVNQLPIEKLDSLFQVEVVQAINAQKLHFKWNDDIAKYKATGHLNDQPTDKEPVRKDLHFGAAGGLYSEAFNYSKFLIAVMNGAILSAKTRDEMLKEQIQLADDEINKIIMNSTGWSLGFGIIPTSIGNFYWHSGNNQDFQSWFHFHPEKKYGIVLLSNCDKIQSPDFFIRFFNFLDNEITFDISSLN